LPTIHIARLFYRMRFCCFIFLLLIGCAEPKDQLFSYGKSLGRVSKKLEEASGLAASINNPGYFWTVNDSGNAAEVFLIDDHANIQLVCQLTKATNRDWEEIRIGSDSGKNYLYIADIGDNKGEYDLKFIYRFEEPLLSTAKKVIIDVIDTLIIKMPDGKRDTESVMIDPLTKDLFILSKREESIGLYLTQYPFPNDTLLLEKVLTMPFHNIVSGDISADGQEVLLKTYDNIFYWKKSGSENISELLSKEPKELPYTPEKQGEAIAWALDGSGFYTLSESSKKEAARLLFYKRK
jgi:hypothetical protein